MGAEVRILAPVFGSSFQSRSQGRLPLATAAISAWGFSAPRAPVSEASVDGAALNMPECVPARMVNEYVYCPRLAYIEWVQSDFAHNFETVDGQYRHRAVDDEKGCLPAEVEDGDVIHARSVWLSAPAEDLTARLDLLEARGKTATPVDYQRGAAPDVPGGAWEADKAQLCPRHSCFAPMASSATKGSSTTQLRAPECQWPSTRISCRARESRCKSCGS